MTTLARRAVPLFLFLALACCGGTTNGTTDGGTPGPGICGANVSGTPTGRPVAEQCAASNVPPSSTDAGLLTCATDADCTASPFYRWCRAGTCHADQCFADTDCPSGQACACANEQIGNAEHTNACVATQCRVDADCTSDQVCSATAQDLCSGGGPFFACHSSADTCRVDADCCSSSPSCRYQPAEGHWACVTQCTVAG
jgi:hypothetical protein